MENGTHIKHYILYGAEQSLNACCSYRCRHHRRHFLQNRTEKGLETRKQFINVIQCTTRRSVLQHCPYGLKNASSGDKESRNQVHKGTLQEKLKVETLSC